MLLRHVMRQWIAVLLVSLWSGAIQPASAQSQTARGVGSARIDRIVAIGDLHGDLIATRAALKLAGVIDSTDRWIGGTTQLVQTGDILDRGDDEVVIFALFRRIAAEANAAGGRVHLLNGNHELMNSYLDFRYTTAGGFGAYASTPDPTPAVSLPSKIKAEQKGRAFAFRPGGPMAMQFAAQPTLFSLGDNAFAHGGILPWQARWGIDSINHMISAWLRNQAPMPEWVKGKEKSPVWNRLYSKAPDGAACDSAMVSLKTLGLKRMVVGHSIQKSGITSYCGGAVWAIDVGMSSFAKGRISVLEIRGDSLRILGPVDHPPVKGKNKKSGLD